MEEAAVNLVKLYRYYDYFHKVPWIWGVRGFCTKRGNWIQLLRIFRGFCLMLSVNFVYCGGIVTVLLANLLSSVKDPDMTIVGTFMLLVTGFMGVFCGSSGIVMLLFCDLMGNISIELKIIKGTFFTSYFFIRINLLMSYLHDFDCLV
jgi:hypothetical protein